MKRRVPISRRSFFKKAALGTASLLALGAGGIYTVKRLRFRNWQNNVHLDFVFGVHRSVARGLQYAKEIDRAAAEGEPYHFVVMENWNMGAKQRAGWEKDWNNKIEGLRKQHKSLIESGEFGSRHKAFLDADLSADPMQKEFLEEMFTAALKHGLIIKASEQHGPRDLEIITGSYEKYKNAFNADLTKPTAHLIRQISEGVQALATHVDVRNTNIARTIPLLAAEIRRERPELRGKILRGIVQLGRGHSQLIRLMPDNLKNFSINQKFLATQSEPLFNRLMDENLRRKNSIGSQIFALQATIGTLITPSYNAALSDKSQKHIANAIFERIANLNVTQCRQILDSVENKVSQERAVIILRKIGIISINQ